jgi:hypothetical protein
MAATGHFKYLVEKLRDYWTVTFSGKTNGEFASRGQACHSAMKDGIRVGHMGHDVEIGLRDEGGNTRTVWTSGQHEKPAQSPPRSPDTPAP